MNLRMHSPEAVPLAPTVSRRSVPVLGSENGLGTPYTAARRPINLASTMIVGVIAAPEQPRGRRAAQIPARDALRASQKRREAAPAPSRLDGQAPPGEPVTNPIRTGSCAKNPPRTRLKPPCFGVYGM